MIVRKKDPAWQIIFQPAHGLLAGKIAMELSTDIAFHARFETIFATSIHDDYPEEFAPGEHKYVTDAGAPRAFTEMEMSMDLRFRETQLGIEVAFRKSLWMGLLRSYHAHTLYADEDISKPFKEYLELESARRRKVLRQLGLKKSDLGNAYSIMQFCDRCSLILCQDEIPAMERKLEVSPLENKRRDIWRKKDQAICIEPWPFSKSEFTVDVLLLELTDIAFADDAELGQALAEAKAEMQNFYFQRV